jgi:DNA-binding MarR family transcriptional regulator
VTAELDPLIHVPARLKIVATLAALPDGDALSFTRLQDMLGLTPGNLIIQLRKLEDAGYISRTKTRNGSAQKTTVTLTSQGRAALRTYTRALRDLLGGLDIGAPSPGDTVHEIATERMRS